MFQRGKQVSIKIKKPERISKARVGESTARACFESWVAGLSLWLREAGVLGAGRPGVLHSGGGSPGHALLLICATRRLEAAGLARM